VFAVPGRGAVGGAAVTATAVRHDGELRPTSAPLWRPAGTPGPSPGSWEQVAGGHGRTLVARATPVAGERHPSVLHLRTRRARRRRILIASSVLAILVALALPWGGAGQRPLATPGSVLAGAAVLHHSVYVVQPGDTMWSIAQRLDPGADPRPVVARLGAEVGSDTLQPGERLRLP
jgi:LysM domain-containing protein